MRTLCPRCRSVPCVCLAEDELTGRITQLTTLRPLHEYGLGPDTERLKRQADELREQLEDLAAHLRELGEAHERMSELLAAILRDLQ